MSKLERIRVVVADFDLFVPVMPGVDAVRELHERLSRPGHRGDD
jgi:hypothetical protein